MIKSLRIRNFRCFEDHTVPLKETSILVGRNNAGKSTIVEALRLVALVCGRCEVLPYRYPALREFPKTMGIEPSLRGLEFNEQGLFHRYSDPPASIAARFESGNTVTVYIGAGGAIHATIETADGFVVSTPTQARRQRLNAVSILPQIGPLSREERLLKPNTVTGSWTSYLASSHFRNQLYLRPDLFDQFRESAEASWHGLRIRGEPTLAIQEDGSLLTLLVQDGDFTAEVAWMGHGLQMWLQTMWFLAQCEAAGTVILDEPDIYMHADLQRKLVRLLRNRYRQIIIATHSVEIMAEVEHDEVLVIDRSKPKSVFTNSIPAVQSVIDHIGGVHIIALARLASAKRCLIVEGDDLYLLKRFQNTLFPESEMPFDTLPSWSMGGWSKWQSALQLGPFLRSSGGISIKPYCILDADYHTQAEKLELYGEAKCADVALHIWRRKEIENYLLVPSAIRRAIKANSRNGQAAPDVDAIAQKLGDVVDSFREDVTLRLATNIQERDRRLALATAMEEARLIVNASWASEGAGLPLVSGKLAIEAMKRWCQADYGISFSNVAVAKGLSRAEMPDELVNVVTAIETGTDFPGP